MSYIDTDVWHNKRESTRRKVRCTILIDGVDVTSRFDPHLLSVTAIDTLGGVDQCHIELDDREGRLKIPVTWSSYVAVFVGWHSESTYYAFEGWVTEVESGFSCGTGGRRLWIDATGTPRNEGKSPSMKNWGEGAPPGQQEGQKIPLSQVLQEAGKAAGFTVQIGASFQNVMRDYWSMQTESFMHFGQRMADELGGYFKIKGKTAYLRDAPDLSGGIEAVWGRNLIEWRIRPYIGRTQWGGSKQDHFNIAQGIWEETKKQFGGEGVFGGASAITQLPNPAPNSSVAEQSNDGSNNFANAARGAGWVSINGEPQARGGMVVTVRGARPDVDGTYVIDEAHHKYERGSGYTTMLKLRFPMAKAPSGTEGGASPTLPQNQ